MNTTEHKDKVTKPRKHNRRQNRWDAMCRTSTWPASSGSISSKIPFNTCAKDWNSIRFSYVVTKSIVWKTTLRAQCFKAHAQLISWRVPVRCDFSFARIKEECFQFVKGIWKTNLYFYLNYMRWINIFLPSLS